MNSRRLVSALSLSALVLSIAGCVEPVKLAVSPITPTVMPSVEHPCAAGEDCLAAARATHKVSLANDEEFVFAKISPDGRRILTQIATKVAATGKRVPPPKMSIALLDAVDGKQLWRATLAQNANVAAEDAFFLGNEKVAIVTEFGFNWPNTLLVLDASSGREVWRTPTATPGAEPVHMAWYDPEQKLLFVGSTTLRVLDPDTGTLIATRGSFHKTKNPRVTGGIPLVSGDDVYFYDYGLVRFSRDDRKFDWGRKFVTFAEDDYTGANVGLAIAGALLGAYNTGSIPPDFMVGRNPEPLLMNDRIYAAGLGVVHCIDATNGNLVWSKDLAVPEVAKLVAQGDTLYVLAGGTYLFWHGRQGMSVREPVRSGVFALSLADGTPIASFAAPFNRNEVTRSFTAEEVEKYDEDDAFEEEEDWGPPKPGAAAPAAGGAASPAKKESFFTKIHLVGMEPLNGKLFVASDEAIHLLDATGAELEKRPSGEIGKISAIARCGETIIVRGHDGVAAFSAVDGKELWRRKIAPAAKVDAAEGGYEPRIRTLPWRNFRTVESAHFGGELFWICRQREIVALPGAEGSMIALNVKDGTTAWQLPISEHVGLDLHRRPAHLVSLDGSEVNVFTIE